MSEIVGMLDRLIAEFEARATEMDFKGTKAPYQNHHSRGYYSGQAAASRSDANALRYLRERITEKVAA